MAGQPRVQFHAGKTVCVDREARHLLVIQPGADRHAGEVVAFLDQFLEALAVLGGDVYQYRQPVDHVLEVIHLRGHDLQGISGKVVCKHHAVAVHDQPAVGHHRDDEYAVLLSQRVVIVVLDHLNVEKAHEQDKEGEQHGAAGDCQPQLEIVELALMVAKLDGAVHRRSGECRQAHAGRTLYTSSGSCRERSGILNRNRVTGHNSAPARLGTKYDQPGYSPPAAARTASTITCISTRIANTCSI